MAKLNFPDPNVTQTYTEAGITWTWNSTLKVWSAEYGTGFDETAADARYLRIDDAAPDQTRVSGAATFSELTTHEAGVKVTGGDPTQIVQGVSASAGATHLVTGNEVKLSIYPDGAQNLCETKNGLVERTILRLNGNTTGSESIGLRTSSKPDTTAANYRGVYVDSPGAGKVTSDCTGVYVQNIADTASKTYAFFAQSASGTNDNYNFYASGTAPNWFEGDILAKDIRSSGFYRNKKPLGANNSVSCVAAIADHNNQDITDSISFVAGKPQNVTDNRLTTTAYQVNSSFGSDYTDGTRKAYGFKSNMPAAANGSTFNFYAAGTAPNYFDGEVQVRNSFRTGAAIDTPGRVADTVGLFGLSIETSGVGAVFSIGRNGGGGPAMQIKQVPADVLLQFKCETGGSITAIGQIKNNAAGNNIEITGLAGGPLILDEGADARLVTSTEEISNASAVVQQLQPVKINGTRHGFTAGALQPLFAEAVTGTAGATEDIGTYTDPDGNVQTEITEPEAIPFGATWEQTGTRDVYQGVDQTKLIPLLTKALQEALERIEALENA